MEDHYIALDQVSIHAISHNTNCEGTPVVCIPGISGCAEDFIPLMEEGLSSPIIAISCRGRGKSSTPKSGYSVVDHGSDISRVIEHFGIERYFLLGVSFGGIYALEHAQRTSNSIEGLIVVDHQLQSKSMLAGWADRFSRFTYNNVRLAENTSFEALLGIEKETEPTDFSTFFAASEIRSLLMVGAKDPNSAMLRPQDIEMYKANMNCTIEVFKESDHMIRFCEPKRYYDCIRKFVGTASN